jgi:hypothetical protein
MNMANHTILVAVCYSLLIKVNKFICMHLYTSTIKSPDNKATHIVPL